MRATFPFDVNGTLVRYICLSAGLLLSRCQPRLDEDTLVKTFKLLVSSVCVLSMLVPPATAPVFAAELSRSAYEDCAARDETGLATALTTISADALKTGIGKLDYAALVNNAWYEHNLDEIIDKRVDLAVEEVKTETSWGERIKSLANAETSQKLATAVAERVYHSEAVKGALEAVAQDVAKDVGKSIETATTDAAAPVLSCLKAFIGPRYGTAVADAVAGDAGKDISVDPSKGVGEPSAGAVIKQSSGGIAGATILIVRRQLANLATRVGQRIVGSVLSRLVSVAAGGIGLVLIAKDIWEFRNGILPIIASEMKSQATKDKVKEELSATIAQQIGEHLKEIAQASADRVIEIWKEFKRAHAIALRIAEGNGAFRAFLDSVAPSRLSRLDEIVGIIVASEGESAVVTRLGDGTLNTAVHVMPEAAIQIARETRSLQDAIAWNGIAGDKITAVLEYELHKRSKPSDFTLVSLNRILALQDRAAIMRLASVPAKSREALFAVDGNDLNVLARNLSEDELTTLASYLEGLQAGPRERVLRAVATSPSKMQVLARTRVRDAIIASADQSEAVGMMLDTPSAFSPHLFAHDVKLAFEGKVNPLLLWDKHPAGVGFAGALALLLLLWFMRLFRRPQRVNTAIPAAPEAASPPPGTA